MNQSTRQEILTMLKTMGPLTVSEIAKELEITEMAVRRHLNTLERDNLIETSLMRQAMGRPTNIYRLSEQAEKFFPKNYSDLTIDFLKDIETMEGTEKVRYLFNRRKERLYNELSEQMADVEFAKKVELLAEYQNNKGYMVELEKEETGNFILKEHNCPISQIAREFHIACECELALFRELLGTSVERISCYAEGDHNCVFAIEGTTIKKSS